MNTYGILEEFFEMYGNGERQQEKKQNNMEYPEHIRVVKRGDIDDGNIVSEQE